MIPDAADEVARKRAVLQKFGLGDGDWLAAAQAPVTVSEVEVRRPPEARSIHDRKHLDAPTYTPPRHEYVRRRAHVAPITHAEWDLVADLLPDQAQHRLSWRDIIDALRMIVFRGVRWVEVGAAPRMRLRQSRPEMWTALQERAETLPAEHSAFAEDMMVLGTFCKRYIARLNTRQPRSGQVAARILAD